MPPFKPVKEGDVFDLGGKTLEVYELPGHTPGGIVLLLKEDRILFTGDGVNHYLWMMLDGCLKLSDYVKSLDRIMFLENEADYILQGHAQVFEDISLMRCVRNGIVEIIEGKTENDEPYEWFGGVGKKHPFNLEVGKSRGPHREITWAPPGNGDDHYPDCGDDGYMHESKLIKLHTLIMYSLLYVIYSSIYVFQKGNRS